MSDFFNISNIIENTNYNNNLKWCNINSSYKKILINNYVNNIKNNNEYGLFCKNYTFLKKILLNKPINEKNVKYTISILMLGHYIIDINGINFNYKKKRIYIFNKNHIIDYFLYISKCNKI